ncbi:MAG: metal-dependent transcriptional regulator [Spirochaetia bacterium]|nr:metal-dependent transcriptional regulator [Spirochaetia bacterium]
MTSTVEDYLKQLVSLEIEQGLELIPMKKVCTALGVTPGTATTMIQRLDEKGLVEYQHHKGCRLTEEGRRSGRYTLRRHRLIELFLVNTLGMDWATVHEEAEMIEHTLSHEVVERLDHFLGHPEQGPHGGPIPDTQGILPCRGTTLSLAEIPGGGRVQIFSVKDRDEALLGYLASVGLLPGTRLEVASISEGSGIMTLRHEEEPEREVVLAREVVRLSLEQASHIRVLHLSEDG